MVKGAAAFGITHDLAGRLGHLARSTTLVGRVDKLVNPCAHQGIVGVRLQEGILLFETLRHANIIGIHASHNVVLAQL